MANKRNSNPKANSGPLILIGGGLIVIISILLWQVLASTPQSNNMLPHQQRTSASHMPTFQGFLSPMQKQRLIIIRPFLWMFAMWMFMMQTTFRAP